MTHRLKALSIGLVAAGAVLFGGLASLPTVLAAFQTAAAPLELVVSPGTITVTSQSSGANAIAVKGSGYSGNVSITVSGLPSNIVTHAPSTDELAAGKGGYYCSSHCGSQDFPLTVSVTDGQWTSVGPTLLAGSGATAGSSTVTITATAGGQSVSKSFTLRIINDEYQIPEGGGPPTQAGTANPDAIVTVNNSAFSSTSYKLRLSAGGSTSTDVDVKNNSSSSQTVSLTSSIAGSGVDGVTSELTGGLSSSSVSLAANETKTVSLSLSAAAAAKTGSYEVVLGVAQSDSSNRAGLNINVAVTGASASSQAPPGSSSSPSTSSGTSSASSGSSSGSSSPSTGSSTTTSSPSEAQQAATQAATLNAKKKTTAAKPAATTVAPAPGAPVLTLAADPLAETQLLTGVTHVLSVVGTVHDGAGIAIPGATVTLDGDHHGPVTMTNQAGQFVVSSQSQVSNRDDLPESVALAISHPSYDTVSEKIPLDRSATSTQASKDLALKAKDTAATVAAGAGTVGTPVMVKAEHFPAGSQLHFFWNPFFTLRDTNADGSQPITQRGLDGGKGRGADGGLVDLPVLTVDADGKGEIQVSPPGLPGTYTLLATTDVAPTIPADTPSPGAAGYYPSAGTAVTHVPIGGAASISSIADSVAQHFFGTSLGNLTATQRAAAANFFAPVPATVTTSRISGQPVVIGATAATTTSGTATDQHLTGTPLPKVIYARLKQPTQLAVTTKTKDGVEQTYRYDSASILPNQATLNARLVALAGSTLDTGGSMTVGVDGGTPVTLATADLQQDLVARFLPDRLELVIKVGDRVFSLEGFAREVGLQSATVLRATERAAEVLTDLAAVQDASWLPYTTPIGASQAQRITCGFERRDCQLAEGAFYTTITDQTIVGGRSLYDSLTKERRCFRTAYPTDPKTGKQLIPRDPHGHCVLFYVDDYKLWLDSSVVPAGSPPFHVHPAGNPDSRILGITDEFRSHPYRDERTGELKTNYELVSADSIAKQYQASNELGQLAQRTIEEWWETQQTAEVTRIDARFVAAKGELERARVRSRELGYSITQVGAVAAPISNRPSGIGVARAQEESTPSEVTVDQIRETNYVRVRYQGVPAALSVTDPLGRAVGLNPADGTHFEQLEGATDAGNGTASSELFLPNLAEGEYLVTVTGSEPGDGQVTIETAAGTEQPSLSSATLSLTPAMPQTVTAKVAFAAKRTVSIWTELGPWLGWLIVLGAIAIIVTVSRYRRSQLTG